MRVFTRPSLGIVALCLLTACGGGSSAPGTTTTTAGGNGFFVPFKAAPVPNTSDGVNGLIVVRSDSLQTAPTLVTPATVNLLDYALPYTMSASGLATGGSPATLVYATTGATGGDHLWTLALSDSSGLTPKQMSTLTFPTGAPFQFCDSVEAYENLTNADSAIILLALPTAAQSTCNGSATTLNWILVHVTDGAATAPLNLSVTSGSGQLQPIYHPSGMLAGFATIDDNNNLIFYSGEGFANPTILLTGALDFRDLQPNMASPLGNVSSTPAFVFVTVSFTKGNEALYRISDTGAISADLYDFSGDVTDGFAADAANLYWTDTMQVASSYVQNIAQAPLDGSSAAQVLLAQPMTNNQLTLLGSIGGELVLLGGTSNPATGTSTSTVEMLPSGTPTAPTTIATFNQPASAIVAGSEIFLTLITPGISVAVPLAYSTEVIAPDGSIVEPLIAQSGFLVYNRNPLMQVKNVTDAGFLGGGSVYGLTLNPGSPPISALFNTVSGAPYTLPSGTVVADAFGFAPGLAVGAGSDTTGNFGLIYDLSKNVIQQVTMHDTNITFNLPLY